GDRRLAGPLADVADVARPLFGRGGPAPLVQCYSHELAIVIGTFSAVSFRVSNILFEPELGADALYLSNGLFEPLFVRQLRGLLADVADVAGRLFGRGGPPPLVQCYSHELAIVIGAFSAVGFRERPRRRLLESVQHLVALTEHGGAAFLQEQNLVRSRQGGGS